MAGAGRRAAVLHALRGPAFSIRRKGIPPRTATQKKDPVMLKDLAAIAASALTVVALDALWLGWLMKDFVRERLGPLMLEVPRFGVAAAFYLLFAVGVLLFAVRPSLESGSIGRAAFTGALLGFFCYMTYDLSNLATLKNWSAQFSAVDIAWGTFVGAVAAATGFAAYRAVGV